MHNGIIKRILVLLVVATAGMMQDTKAQNVAVKSNVLADAFLNPNLGIEIRLAPKWTLDATGQILVLRPLFRALRRCSHPWRTV